MRPLTSPGFFFTFGFTCLLFACSDRSSSEDAIVDEGALRTNANKTFVCTPIDADEACTEACINKLTIKTSSSGSTASIKVEREDDDGNAIAPLVHAEAASFALKKKTLQGAWSDDEEVNVSVRKVGPGERYEGQASVVDVGTFAVECKPEGAADLPLYVRTAHPFDECNGKNADGQIIRCLKGATCRDEEGNEIAVLQRKKGICEPQFVRTAARGDACNVNPAESVAIVLCQRGSGLRCRNAAGAEIPLAQSSEAGRCE